MSNFMQAAFNAAIDNAKQPERWYVVLVESFQAYGGPEEGGWYYRVANVVAYREYPNEELATAAKDAVEKLAEELRIESRNAHGEMCLRSMEWLEARGLDADFLPEPDGESEYRVSVTTELPVFDNSRPHYE